MHFSNFLVFFSILGAAFISYITSHAGMIFPKPRPIRVDGEILPSANIDSILSKDTIVQPGHSKKLFPCGSTEKSEITPLVPGETLQVQIDVNNMHGGGHCQFSLSYNDGTTFVVIHQVLDGCITKNRDRKNKLMDFVIPVPIPENLPGGDAIFAWTWVTYTSNQPEYYMTCGDVQIPGDAKGTVVGTPLVVANIEYKRGALQFYAKNPEYLFLYQKAPKLTMEVDGENVKVTPEAFAETRHLLTKDPLFQFFNSASPPILSPPESSQTPGVDAGSTSWFRPQPPSPLSSPPRQPNSPKPLAPSTPSRPPGSLRPLPPPTTFSKPSIPPASVKGKSPPTSPRLTQTTVSKNVGGPASEPGPVFIPINMSRNPHKDN